MIALPEPIALTDDLIVRLDQCWLAGFAQLSAENKQTLITLPQIFAETPLASALSTAIDNLFQGVYQPQHFLTLAAARAALQGAQYAHLRQSVTTLLKRPNTDSSVLQVTGTIPPEPLVNATAHWLMDIALQGYGRLDARTLSAFDSTLSQIQALPERLPLALMVNAIIDELAGAVPVSNPQNAPLFRWMDLWSRAMLMTMPQPAPSPQPTSGTLYLMGAEHHNQNRLYSLSFYGILENPDGATWVKTTFSTYKVNAIKPDELWALLPQAKPLYEAFRTGKALTLTQIPLLPTGDLLWDETCATETQPYAFAEIASRYLAPDAPETLHIIPPLPGKQHPIHLAEPVLLAKYTLTDDLIQSGEFQMRLHLPENHKELPKLPRHDTLVGLIRYDNQGFYIQPLAVAQGKKAPAFATIRNSAKLFEAPAKNSAIMLLRERASRLLREKS
jgi:hypothetical protein